MQATNGQRAWPPQRLVWPVSAGVILLVAGVVGISVWLGAARGGDDSSGDMDSNAPWPALAEAEIVHVVYASSGSETVEVWIDRVSGDAMQSTTNAAGEVVAVMQRSGLTLTEYYLMFGHASLMTRTVLDADDPMLLFATLQLEGYRVGLETGGVTRVEKGRTEYDGQPVIEVHAWPDGELEHLALLDPGTLYPLALFTLDGEQKPFTYSLLEGFERSAVDPDVFTFDFGEPEQIDQTTRLSADAQAAFDAFPLYTLGDSFEGHTLDRVERVQTNANDTRPAGDEVLAMYLLRSEEGTDSIQVRSRAALTDAERDGSEPDSVPALGAPGEDVALSTGEIVRVAQLNMNVETPLFMIQLDRPDGFVWIQIEDRDAGLRAAETLVRMNAGVFAPE